MYSSRDCMLRCIKTIVFFHDVTGSHLPNISDTLNYVISIKYHTAGAILRGFNEAMLKYDQ